MTERELSASINIVVVAELEETRAEFEDWPTLKLLTPPRLKLVPPLLTPPMPEESDRLAPVEDELDPLQFFS